MTSGREEGEGKKQSAMVSSFVCIWRNVEFEYTYECGMATDDIWEGGRQISFLLVWYPTLVRIYRGHLFATPVGYLVSIVILVYERERPNGFELEFDVPCAHTGVEGGLRYTKREF